MEAQQNAAGTTNGALEQHITINSRESDLVPNGHSVENEKGPTESMGLIISVLQQCDAVRWQSHLKRFQSNGIDDETLKSKPCHIDESPTPTDDDPIWSLLFPDVALRTEFKRLWTSSITTTTTSSSSTVELHSVAVTVAINDETESEAQYEPKKHPTPKTSKIPQPPQPSTSKNNAICTTVPDPVNCLCFRLKHISMDFRGRNPIICNRTFLCGTDVCTFATTWILILVPSVFFLWAQFAYLPQNSLTAFIVCTSISFLSCGLTSFFLLRVNMTDPGIIPRFKRDAPQFGPFNQHDRYCKTCNIIRPMHAKHCRVCDNCVNGFDHHCPWTGTCIAERNIRYFVGFIFFAGTYGGVTLIICLMMLINRPGAQRLNPAAMSGIVLLGIYGAIMSLLLVSMAISYIGMLADGLTMNEKLKYGRKLMTDAERKKIKDGGKESVFKIYWRVFCGPLPESEIYQ